MCGIAGIFNLNLTSYKNLRLHLKAMEQLQAHRGPDGNGIWTEENSRVGFSHVRLSIIDLGTGAQPMQDQAANWITYNGEIYNYIELREELGNFYSFKTDSDTEVILASYLKWGRDCVNHLRGMFAFAIWDNKKQSLFCARDRFGIKPFYYTVHRGTFYFASEAKTLLPFVPEISTDLDALKDYLTFQFVLGTKTLFSHISKLLPAHHLTIENGTVSTHKYWEVNYSLDWNHTKQYFQKKTEECLYDSIRLHLRSHVPVGAYLSGGVDSSIIGSLAAAMQKGEPFKAFNGMFSTGPEYDESHYARAVAEKNNLNLFIADIQPRDFISNIRKVIYHLDYPLAGPGSFPQYMVSELAARHLKVVLGGQGGDEIFGGYARYLIAYFEQCIKGAIEGTMSGGNYVVTYESIIPNLSTLREYKPLMKEFFSTGLFEERDKRYFKLINRANTLKDEIQWELMKNYSAFDIFREIFWGKNVEKESYFDSMTHFDFKTLLPALLHVEDRMSMAHGLESRVPLLDHPLVELAATMPSNVKFENGNLKHLLKTTFSGLLPPSVIGRKDKMGFPVPLAEWMRGELFEFINDIFAAPNAQKRNYLNPEFDIRSLINEEGKFSRKLWGLLSLELWQQEFHDKRSEYEKIIYQ